jgi:hypothetical protein
MSEARPWQMVAAAMRAGQTSATPSDGGSCALVSEARNVAMQLRAVLGVTVDPKGENAIRALLHMRDNALLTQSNAQSLCGSSKGSIQKYSISCATNSQLLCMSSRPFQ